MSGPTREKALLGVPDRWMFCPKTGQIVANRFFPFKTPLCALYDDQVEKRLQFHPTDVFEHQQVRGRKIGLWIDLTKTDRYYSPQEVESRGCQYKKLALAGHGSTPQPEEVAAFLRVANAFVEKNPDDLIAIHCTHGFNRTGFLICAYMCVVQDWAVDAAILAFSRERPCGIYKQDYLSDLFARYGDPEDCVEAPARPTWEFNEDGGMADDARPSSSGVSNGSHTNGAEQRNGSSTSSGKRFMDGLVPSVTLVDDESKKAQLRGKIKELCGARMDGFPGLQPVSMEASPERNNLEMLKNKSYMVSWKADGMRYLIYILDEGEVYAFDRDNEVFLIPNLRFPHRKHPRHIRNTLVDAEMIIDKVRDQNGVEMDMPRLLIYDIIWFEEINIRACNFDQRKSCMYNEIKKPREEAMKRGEIIREREPMSVRLKDFWEVVSVPKLFEPKFTQTIGHEIDGLIFQPVDEPYVAGRCDSVLKWKPPSHNSIDFKLQIRKQNKEGELPGYVGFLYVQHCADPIATMKATKKLQPYDGKIIECNYVKGEWCFMRERTDKSLPNSFKTAKAVFNSMQYPITKENLCNYVMRVAKKRRVPGMPGGGGGGDPKRPRV